MAAFTTKKVSKVKGFDADASYSVEGADGGSFAIASNKKELKQLMTSDADVVYDEKKGKLFLNDNGIFNTLFGLSGLGPFQLLNNFFGTLVGYLTLCLPLVVVLQLISLANVDRTLIEAAKLDGANRFAIIRDIILPQLAPMTFFVVLIAMINSAKTFEATISLTNGGPNNASTTLGYAIYQNAFVHFDMWLASAQSWVLCLIVGGISMLHYRLQQRKV